jgi:hypothetical protein
MPLEIHELVIRVTVAEPESQPTNWEALQRRLKTELLEACRDEIQAQLQRVEER